MRRGFGQNSTRILWMAAAVAVIVAAAVVAGSLIWRTSESEEPTRTSRDEARALIAAAKRDFGLPYDEDHLTTGAAAGEGAPGAPAADSLFGEVDFSDTEALAGRLRILSKQLSASGAYTVEESAQIKAALQDAEAALRDARSSQEGRRAVAEFLDQLEDISRSVNRPW